MTLRPMARRRGRGRGRRLRAGAGPRHARGDGQVCFTITRASHYESFNTSGTGYKDTWRRRRRQGRIDLRNVTFERLEPFTIPGDPGMPAAVRSGPLDSAQFRTAQCSNLTPIFIGMHRNAPLSPMKRVTGYTIPMHLWLLCTYGSYAPCRANARTANGLEQPSRRSELR
jgi:hypothetical protein